MYDDALTREQFHELSDAVAQDDGARIRSIIKHLPPVNQARLIESSTPPTRRLLWANIADETQPEVLTELSEDIQSQFLERMEASEVAAATEGLETDDIVDILQQLPENVIQDVLQEMSWQDRHRVERVLSFDEDTAGGLMNTDTITVRPKFTLDVVLRYLRRHDDLPNTTDSLFVVNSGDEYVGTLPLSRVLTSDPSMTVREVMVTSVEPIIATATDREVAQLFERNDLVSAPVVDSNGCLLGRITIDDVVDVIREDTDHNMMGLAGLDDDIDTFATVRKSLPRRALWLSINLLAAFTSSTVIKMFEATIEQVVALAILMPIVASMGGVAGNQTLTVVIRGMALGQISRSNLGWLLRRELTMGLINGIFFAVSVGIMSYFWFGAWTLGLVIGLALIFNLLNAAIAGTVIPLVLKSMKIDPALAGGMIQTTATDVLGFLSFLGLATIFYG
ncbi:magnesium transporter [Umboniibacter marinipuniceus]|uniref:Magnesium transporter MgtE n=1 Tax=Umboniibacter marinipuniceus TaxID=569599 RepID=A0A3M0A3V1_9GAMM|nr:magnesium transporter [Umboniibacter marinipuniceus]RMA79450.1 magnesium transporter [Umboniibacter marinipuniceus]